MNKDRFYIGSGDYFGESGPNDLFNDVYVPRLSMKEIARMFEEIYNIGFQTGLIMKEVRIKKVGVYSPTLILSCFQIFLLLMF